MYNGAVYVNHGGIVPKVPAVPVTPNKANAYITETIINTTIITYMQTPVPWVKAVKAIIVTPIAGCP